MTDTKGTILVRKKDWERLLTTVEALVDVHSQLLTRSRELGNELKSRTLQIAQAREEKRSPASRFCVNCGRDLSRNDTYCDRCGFKVV